MTENWISLSLNLTTGLIRLEPLELWHIDPLCEIARDKKIWAFYAVDGSDPIILRDSLETAMQDRCTGKQYPFAVIDVRNNQPIGSTRYLEPLYQHRKLEIGWTWLAPQYWGDGTNTICKYLLLKHCFETLGTVRVQFRTDEMNIRSRKAIEKIGGQYEGVLRHDMIRGNGSYRNSAYFSIIDTEWPQLKVHLEGMLTSFS